MDISSHTNLQSGFWYEYAAEENNSKGNNDERTSEEVLPKRLDL